jgi:hypothetical protein
MIRSTLTMAMIGTVIALWSCASHQQSDSKAAAQLPPLEILKIPEGTQAKTTYFSKLVLNLPPGSNYGTDGLGGFCIDKQPLIWGDQTVVLAEDDIRKSFNAVMSKGRYPVYGRTEVLFEDPAQADLVAAGLVKQAKVELCRDSNPLGNLFMPRGGAKVSVMGKAAITVEWQILSRREGKVIFQTTTKGILNENMYGTTLRQIIIGAFANAVERLIADKEFLELVTAPQGQIRS